MLIQQCLSDKMDSGSTACKLPNMELDGASSILSITPFDNKDSFSNDAHDYLSDSYMYMVDSRTLIEGNYL